MAIETQAYTITVAFFSGTTYGYTKISLPTGSIVPDPAYLQDDTPPGNIEWMEISDRTSSGGTEMWFDPGDESPTEWDFDSILTLTLSRSGEADVVFDFADVGAGGDLDQGSSTAGTYYWFPSKDSYWGSEAGNEWVATFEGEPAPPPPLPPYDQGTKIKNPKNPGGGVPIPEAEYDETQTAVVTQPATKQGGAGSGGKGKGGGGGPPTDVIIDLPEQAGGPFDLTCFIEGYDFGSGTWYLILAGANITAKNTKQRLKVGSYLNDVANLSANDVLPYMWRVRVEHGDATLVTYSVEYKL